MKYRTDLAVEGVEELETKGIRPGEKDGIIVSHETTDKDIKVTTVEVTSLKGEALVGKPIGTYVTMEIHGLMEGEDNLIDRSAKILADHLSRLVRHSYYLKVLVVGLGNEKVTPDSLGPATVSKVKITSHLFRFFDCDGAEDMSNVCGLAPGVTAITGMETADLIQKAVELTEPDVVIAIDALAARNIERVSTTIQICDTGISPGAGMGNMRKHLNEETLGAKVIAIGVPTVIDSKTLILEAAEAMNLPEAQVSTSMEERDFDMVVTSTDIDFLIKAFSDIIAKALNLILHPGIYS